MSRAGFGPSARASSICAGGGPCGLVCAIMLESLGWQNIRILDRLPPPKPSRDGLWGNSDRSYNIGVSTRGRGILDAMGATDRFTECSTPLTSRSVWSPGKVDPQITKFSDGLPGKQDPPRVRECVRAA
jgi:2-polyprenyl-6-methoxyphenol hydroxylase-like FAD-dependent oxidoreductase